MLEYVGFNVLSAAGHYNEVECGNSGTVKHAHAEEGRVPRKGTVILFCSFHFRNQKLRIPGQICYL
jgi:hypothetical protein